MSPDRLSHVHSLAVYNMCILHAGVGGGVARVVVVCVFDSVQIHVFFVPPRNGHDDSIGNAERVHKVKRPRAEGRVACVRLHVHTSGHPNCRPMPMRHALNMLCCFLLLLV